MRTVVLGLTSPHGVGCLWAKPRTFRAAWFWFFLLVFFFTGPSSLPTKQSRKICYAADPHFWLTSRVTHHRCCHGCLCQEGATPNYLAERRAQNVCAFLPAPARDARCSQAPEAPPPNRRERERERGSQEIEDFSTIVAHIFLACRPRPQTCRPVSPVFSPRQAAHRRWRRTAASTRSRAALLSVDTALRETSSHPSRVQ